MTTEDKVELLNGVIINKLLNEDGYGSKQTYRSGETFNLIAFPEIEIKVDDLF